MQFGILWFSVPPPHHLPICESQLLHLAVFWHKRQPVSLSCTEWSVGQRLTWQIFPWPLKPFELIYRLISCWEVWLSALERNWTDNKHCWNTGGAGCKAISLGGSCKLSLNESQQARYLLIHGHYLCSPGQQVREGKRSFCRQNELISLDTMTKLFQLSKWDYSWKQKIS